MKTIRNIVLASALAASPAFAEEGGLPQLDSSLYPEQLFWLAVTFAVLYVLMWRFALPGVARTQANRSQVIAGEVAAARAASETAKATAAKVEKSLTAARAAAQAKVGELIAQVGEDHAAKQAAQEKEITQQIHKAEAEIAVTREAALKTVRGSATEMAAAVVEKAIGRVA